MTLCKIRIGLFEMCRAQTDEMTLVRWFHGFGWLIKLNVRLPLRLLSDNLSSQGPIIKQKRCERMNRSMRLIAQVQWRTRVLLKVICHRSRDTRSRTFIKRQFRMWKQLPTPAQRPSNHSGDILMCKFDNPEKCINMMPTVLSSDLQTCAAAGWRTWTELLKEIDKRNEN